MLPDLKKVNLLLQTHSRFVLPALLLCAGIVRVAALLALKKSVYYDFLLWDERLYHTWAQRIANGSFSTSSVYEFSPLPAYLMACIYKLFSPDVVYVRVCNILPGMTTCYCISAITKKTAGRTAGLAACLVACFYKPFIFYSVVPLKEMLGVCLFAVTVVLLLRVVEKYGAGCLSGNSESVTTETVLLGIAAGLLLNARPNAVVVTVLIPFILLWYNYKDRRLLKKALGCAFFYLMGVLIAVAPFIIRNYRAAGEIALTASQAGFNLYIGNNLNNPDPYYRPVSFASSSPFEQGIQFTIEACRRTGKRLSSQEASAYWTQQVLHSAREHPAAFLNKLWQKALALCNQFEAGDHYHIGFISNFVGFFTFPFFSIWIVLPLGMAGILTLFPASRNVRVLSAVLAAYSLTLIAFFPTSRFRLLMLVILIPFAVTGIQHVFSAFARKQYATVCIYCAIAGSFFGIEFLPVQATNDMTAYYNTHALILESKGYKDEAMAYWEKSSDMNGSFSAFANLSLAKKYLKKGDFEKTTFFLNKINDNSFAAAPKYEVMGDLFVRQKQIDRAAYAYEKSLHFNSGQIRPRKKLINIYRKINPETASVKEKSLKIIASFYDLI